VVRFLARGGIFALLAAALFVPGISEGALAPRALRPIGDARQATPFAPSLLPSTAGSPVDCVILTPDSLADLFQRLADFQTRSGRPTVVRSLATVRAADPRSNDLPQAIRSFLKSARDLWGTRWAILGGDHDAIPLRTVRVTFGFVQEIPTDAYYADLDGTWDGNGNGIYGEVADNLDMEPDIAVGRLSAATRADATVLVDKALRYARNPIDAALGKQLILAEVLVPSNWQPGQPVQFDGAAVGESLRAHAPLCAAVDRYYENHTLYPGSIPLSHESALAALGRGYHVVYHVGHGSRSVLSFGAPPTATLADLAAITNGDSAAIWISLDCLSAAADFDCVGERLVRRSGGGALAYIGATREAWPEAAAQFNERLQDQLFWTNAATGTTLGEAVENTRSQMLPAARSETPERTSYFETLLLGAPSLPVWRCTPSTFAVTRPSSVPLSATSFAVSVSIGAAPAESALVIAWKNGEDYIAVFTNASGQATVPFHPATAGGFSLAVTRRDARPFLDSLTVTAASPAHFQALQVAPNDAAGGDGDGLVGAGERFALSGIVKNTGQAKSSGAVTLVVSAITSGIVVEKGTAVMGSLSAGAQTAIPDSLRVRALPAPNAARVERLRLIARDAGRADTSEAEIEVTAASLLLANVTRTDTNGNGALEAGEDATFRWTVGNDGSGRLRSPSIAAVNPAAGVSITASTGSLADIGPGGQALTGTLAVHANQAPAGRIFDLRITDTYGHAWTLPIDVVAPAPPSGLAVQGLGAEGITIEWSATSAADLLGYVVLRAANDTTSAAVEASPLPIRSIPSFENAGLQQVTRYWFAVQSVDSSGNRSARTPWLLAFTTPPVIAGWPARLGGATSASPCFSDFDGDGRLEVVVGADRLYVFRHDGSEWIDGDQNPNSLVGVFSDLLVGGIASTPAAGDVDHDGVPEVVAASWMDSLVAVFRSNGSLLPGWPKKAATFWSSPAIGDVDGDGAVDIVIGSNSARLYAWHSNGAEIRDGDSNPATDGVYFVPDEIVISSPAIADVNGDGLREIVFGTLSGRVHVLRQGAPLAGWPFVAGGLMSSSPAIGDLLPGSPGLEIAMACGNDSVYVLTAAGQRAPGWPRPLELTPANGRVPSAALAPLRRHLGDPTLDVIVCGSDGTVRAYDPSGAVLAGWSSVSLGAPTEASPAVADLDGDGALEVLIGAEDRRLHAFRANGMPVSGFPIEIGAEARSTPAIWDVDGDGASDIFLTGWDGKVYAWRYPGSFSSAGMAWPMFRHDNWNTGVATFPVLTAVDPLPAPEHGPTARASLRQNRPNPFNPVTVIGFTVPGAAPLPVTLRVYTVDGRLVRTLVSRDLDPGHHEVRWDGRGDSGASLGTGVYLYRATIGTSSFARKMTLLR